MIALALLLLLIAPLDTAAQRTVRLDDRDACRQCRIRLVLKVTIGDTIGEGIVDSQDYLWVRDAQGRYYHSGNEIGPQIRIFDAAGRFRGLLGRAGSGPGEYSYRSPMFVGAGDTLHVISSGNRAHNVYGPGRGLVRSWKIPAVARSMLEAPNGDLIYASLVRTPAAIGFPLHRFSRTGEYISSFGPEDPYIEVRSMFGLRRLTADPSGSSFFSVHYARFTIDEFAWDGTVLNTITAEQSWFAPVSPTSGPNLPIDGSSPLPAVLVGGHVDRDGVLWLVANIPDPNWRDAFFVHGTPGAHGMNPDRRYLYDSVLVAIDLESKRILKRARTDRLIAGFVAGDVISLEETGLGHPQVQVWSLSLVR
ncbi:MAG TPA: 6-bladed beta-propeller [Longimicrobiales bacterium]